VKDGKLLKATCQASVKPIGYTLDEPAQARVVLRFRSGPTVYCAVFDGAAVVQDVPGRFIGRAAPAAAECPWAPAPCP
jgi:hypothetical protein